MNTPMGNELYFETVELWKSFCEAHNELFHLTCDEYALLLKNEIDLLEETVSRKEQQVSDIGQIDKRRQLHIKNVANYFNLDIKSVKDLLTLFATHPAEQNIHALSKYNALLIDIIERIQEQNKKNQMFINKALRTIQVWKEDATGVKSYPSYNKSGTASRLSLSR